MGGLHTPTGAPLVAVPVSVSGGLLDLLLCDEEPQLQAVPSFTTPAPAKAEADAVKEVPAPFQSPDDEEGVWTHESQLPLWLVRGFEEKLQRQEALAAQRTARADRDGPYPQGVTLMISFTHHHLITEFSTRQPFSHLSFCSDGRVICSHPKVGAHRAPGDCVGCVRNVSRRV